MIQITATTDWAALLRDLLAMRRITQADLARAAGYAEGQVSKWLRGVVVPSAPTIARLLAALGWRIDINPDDQADATPDRRTSA